MEQPAEQDPLIGVTIGNYEVRSKLGVGGMGSVYMAEHPLIGKKVALKVLHPEFSSNQDVVTRFFNEARAVNDIQHPNIVDIVDYGVIPGQGQNTVYFIMEFLDGPSLADLMQQEAPLAPERALAIALQIADALGASHRKGIVHRDLKPDNVMLIQRGRESDFVKVLDFGIAKLTGEQKGSARTRTGIVMGTPAYMSPEQCEGCGKVDHRTDVYSLGILLYEMLTGQVPFTGEGYGEVLVKHLTQAPAPPSTIRGVLPPHVEAVVLKALEKSADARYPSMEDFVEALADPVEYVESRGGIAAFVDVSGGAIAPGGSVIAPGLLAQTTPVPGQLSTLSASSPGQASPLDAGISGGRRIAVIGGVALLVLALAGGAYALLGRGSDPGAVVARIPDAPGRVQPLADVTPALDPRAALGDVASPGEGSSAAEGARSGDVSMKIVSHPEGAEVFVNEEEEPRGMTPLALQLPRGEEVALTLRLEGYQDVTRQLTPTGNGEIDLSLRRDRRTDRPKITRPRPGGKREPQQTKSQKPDSRPNPGTAPKNNKIRNDVQLEEPDWD